MCPVAVDRRFAQTTLKAAVRCPYENYFEKILKTSGLFLPNVVNVYRNAGSGEPTALPTDETANGGSRGAYIIMPK